MARGPGIAPSWGLVAGSSVDSEVATSIALVGVTVGARLDRTWAHRSIGCRVILTVLLLASVVAAAAEGDAEAKVTDVRCCFQISVQYQGTEIVDYGDGNTTPYVFRRGRYIAHWQFAFRLLERVSRDSSGVYDLHPLSPHHHFRLKSQPNVGLYDWTVAAAFSDSPQYVQKACCYARNAHGWQPVCSARNALESTNGFREAAYEEPQVFLASGRLAFGLLAGPGNGFRCGLNDGGLDPMVGSLWGKYVNAPPLRQLLHGTDFAESWSRAGSCPGDGREITGSSASVQARVRFAYFPQSQLYETARSLNSLTGKAPPGFHSPPAPNTPLACHTRTQPPTHP